MITLIYHRRYTRLVRPLALTEVRVRVVLVGQLLTCANAQIKAVSLRHLWPCFQSASAKLL